MAVNVGNRESYVGEKQNQIREGYGIYHYENKFFKYEGEWLNGKKHGHGKLSMADGSYYEGEFQNGEIIGKGYKYFSPSGNKYSGEFYMGELQGQGVMEYSNGTVYEGEWNCNRREGYGVLKNSDSSVYQGYLFDNKRHGEGTMIYSDGGRYDGDWVNDLRQGHGEQRLPDGTIYDGQWRSDLQNGQGTMVHASGVTYEGLWIHGQPARIGTQLLIKDVESPLEVTQGTPFSFNVVTANEEGELIEEQGRDIHIMAGFRFTAPPTDKALSAENTTTALFDMIEDVEEKPIWTPFDYSVVSYPLTDSYNPDELPADSSTVGVSRNRTDLSEIVVPEDEEIQALSDSQSTKVFGSGAGAGAGPETDEQTPANVEVIRTESVNTDDKDTVITEHTSSDLQMVPPEGSSVQLPPVANRRTIQGQVSFNNMILPAAPPMYRPFVISELEEDRKTESRASKSKPGSRQGKKEDDTDSRPSTKSKKIGDERFARPVEGNPTQSPPPPDSDQTDNNENSDLKHLMAEPGEYVIIVEDKTEPPFIGLTMKPAYLLVRVVLPKKPKRKMSTKPQGPKWDTSHHITNTVSQYKVDMAIYETAAAALAPVTETEP